MICFLFPLVKYNLFFISQKQLDKEHYTIVNEDEDADDLEQVDIKIPENWTELSHNDQLDCVYKIETILNELANQYQTVDETDVIKFSVNQKVFIYMQTHPDEVRQYFRITLQNFYEDLMNVYKTSLLQV